jgi:hypothetical protein
MGIRRIPLNAQEHAELFPDGWLAAARLEPYRVDWRSPDGQWIRGAPLPFRAVPMTDREKRAYAERNSWATDATDWPEVLPPFDRTPPPLLTAPDGLLLIHRLPTADQRDTRYDVVDRHGVLLGQLVMAPNQRLLGFGARSVYVITIDDDGIQRLSRHAWTFARLPGCSRPCRARHGRTSCADPTLMKAA